ncbi:unnamed protein product [Rhizophagus irregularis]|nr:unnamed protein product [Rhizophagus irregularis]
MVHTVFVYDDDEFDVILVFSIANTFSNLVEGEKDKAGFNEIDEFQGKKEVNNTFKNEASFLRREIEETSIFIVIVKNSHLLITSTPDLKLIDVVRPSIKMDITIYLPFCDNK